MFFYLSKIIWAVLDPANLIALLFAAGLMAGALRFRKTGAGLLLSSFLILLVCGVLPLGQSALYFLETRIMRPASLPDRIDGILVLGGAVETAKSERSGQTELNEGAERLTTAIALSRQYPDAKIVFSGGNNALRRATRSEGRDTAVFLAGMGVDNPNVIYEKNSRNTYENIKNSYQLVKPSPGENWLLVTSAFHQKRSLAIAAKQGWGLIPYPVDYRSQGRYLFLPSRLDVLDNLYSSRLFLREMVGIAAYKMTGKL